MRTEAWIDRLHSACQSLRHVGGLIDLDEAGLRAAKFPAAFVVPLAEDAEENGLLGAHRQRLRQTYAVILALRSARTSARDDTDVLHALREEVRAALCGWSPNPPNDEEVQFRSGSLLDASGPTLLWQDEYTLTTHWSSTP